TKQLIEAYNKYGTSILSGVRTDKPEDTKKYGFVGGEEVSEGVIDVKKFIEKPGPGNAPSNLAIVSGFIFTPDIYDALESAIPETIEKGKELYYVDGVNKLLAAGKKVHAVEIKNGKYYDCGNKLEYLKAVVEFGLKHQDLSKEFGQYLKNIVE